MSISRPDSAPPWLALSDLGVIHPAPYTPLAQGVFVMEFQLPLASGSLLLDHQSQDGIARSFAVFYDAQVGLALLHRRGAQVVRHMLAGPLDMGIGLARLIFGFGPRDWTITLQHSDQQQVATGTDTLAFAPQDLAAICACPSRHPAVQWFGFGRDLPQAGAWIGIRTPVPTSLGMVEAAHLRPGDMVMTLDHGPLPVMGVQHLDLPARGSFAPVLLRAAFFGAGQDVLVSPLQKLHLSCGEVEYLFGVDSVFVRAGDLVDGRTALADDRRMVTRGVRLDLGRPALVDAGGLVLGLGEDGPCLNRFESATLVAMMRRQVARVA